MDMISAFQSLPMDLVDHILMMTPWEGQREKRQNCMDQLINMRECLHDYQMGHCAVPSMRKKWLSFSYKSFALFKVRQKRELNRER